MSSLQPLDDLPIWASIVPAEAYAVGTTRLRADERFRSS